MRKGQQVASIVIGASLAAAGLFVLGAPAQAAGRDGACDDGEFCYYYNSNHVGSVSDFTSSVANYGTTQPTCYDFKGIGAGRYVCIKNEAASVWNRSPRTVHVHYNSNYGGPYQPIPPGAKINLSAALKNENASHRFVDAPAPPSVGRLAPDKGTQFVPYLFTWVFHGACLRNEVVHDDLLSSPWVEDQLFKVQPWALQKSVVLNLFTTRKYMYRTAVSKQRVVTFCTNNTTSGDHRYYTTYSPVEYVYQTQVLDEYRDDGGVRITLFPKSNWQLGARPS